MPAGSVSITPVFEKSPSIVHIPNPVGEVLVGDIYWARTNVAAFGTFATNEYAYDGANQWDWAVVTGGSNDVISGSGKTAPEVCPAGWRLPTASEFLALYNASAVGNIPNYKGTWKTVSGVNGVELATYGGTLFFSASGAYGGSYLGTENGYYWGSTEYDARVAYLLHFRLNLEVASMAGDKKVARFSIRCVR